uniref:N-acetylmuramoyl-L-alanine amidase family protein n=1 Tax=Flavobacterium sp. TaxID=239 RepID=UPI004049CFFC
MKNIFKFIGTAFLTITLAFSNVDKKTIVIDVSHGGHDMGANIDGFTEKEIALNIAKKIKELNKNKDVEIILTRDSDYFLSLEDRAIQINALKPDFVISLHTNLSKDINVSGKQIFISNENKQREKSENLAFQLSNSFNNGQVEIKNANLYLLNKVQFPIAVLELGFLSNDNDRLALTSEKGQIELANAVLDLIN